MQSYKDFKFSNNCLLADFFTILNLVQQNGIFFNSIKVCSYAVIKGKTCSIIYTNMASCMHDVKSCS